MAIVQVVRKKTEKVWENAYSGKLRKQYVMIDPIKRFPEVKIEHVNLDF